MSSYGYDQYGEYQWTKREVKHVWCIPATGDTTHFLPNELRLKLFANRIVSNLRFEDEVFDWCEHNCSGPYYVQDNKTTIMFSEESDRTMFLLRYT